MRQKNVRRELPAQEIDGGDRKPFSEPSCRKFLEEDFHLIKIVANGSLFNAQLNSVSVRPRVRPPIDKTLTRVTS